MLQNIYQVWRNQAKALLLGKASDSVMQALGSEKCLIKNNLSLHPIVCVCVWVWGVVGGFDFVNNM